MTTNRLIALLFLQQSSSSREKIVINVEIFWGLTRWCLGTALGLVVLYYALSCPPMHLFYDIAPPAGTSTIYVPGGGFSGFWFHLGFLQSIDDVQDYNYYCFSSGCFSVLAVLLNRTLMKLVEAAEVSQSLWKSGELSSYYLVDHFFDSIVPPEKDFALEHEGILSTIHILVTTKKEGLQIQQPRNRSELKEYLVQTTWIPFITGKGILSGTDTDDMYFDGGFSRLLHPSCEFRLDLPIIWETLAYTFSPGLSLEQVTQLWLEGQRHDYFLPKKQRSPKNDFRMLTN